MVAIKLGCALVMLMVMGGWVANGAINCGQVSKGLAPCLPYLKSGGFVPPRCCGGIRGLIASARNTADRQAACRCLQASARRIPNLSPGYAAALPAKCGVNIPYKISLSTNCATVK